jgi:hypothetical protein
VVFYFATWYFILQRGILVLQRGILVLQRGILFCNGAKWVSSSFCWRYFNFPAAPESVLKCMFFDATA